MNDDIDHDRLTVKFSRVLRATPEEAFDAWTTPSEISQWWDPSGAPLVACTIDLRPQGTFRFVTAGHAPPFEGTYHVVQRPRLLQFGASGATGVVKFEPHVQGTLMRVDITCASAEHFEHLLKLGVATGTGVTLDNLVEHLAARRVSAPSAHV